MRALLLPVTVGLLLSCRDKGATSPTDSDPSDDTGSITEDCADLFIEALDWFDETSTSQLDGAIEFGQTHVIAADEDRLAPPLVSEREALLLFTPGASLDEATDLRVGAFEGDAELGVLAMVPPSEMPLALEQGLTDVLLEPYSTTTWSAHLPWSWVRDGVSLRIGHVADDTLTVHEHLLEGLGAPHRFTQTRTKLVLFGQGDEDTTTLSGPKLVQDFFASAPAAEMWLVDDAPWRLDEIVVPTAIGPRVAHSEDERLAIASDGDRWSILKYQVALRHSLANTGRGMALTDSWEGDSSPYSYGTSFGMGWVVGEDGTISDLNNSPYAAGWTGWTAIWLSECGNTLIHEFGHSFTLYHFTSGTAASWGIADQYPEDGTNLQSHPWGYDTTRRLLRTWYQVDSTGPVGSGDSFAGKNDPMNGGDSSNTITCYPQYTAFHAQQIQSWSQGAATVADLDEGPGIYLWSPEEAAYTLSSADSLFGEPVAVDVPVARMVGTLGNTDEACQTYPPRFGSAGNVFDLPDPEDPALDADYDGAQWFVETHFADGHLERALINRGTITDTSQYLFSFNLALEDEPTQVDLYFSDTTYPNIDIAGATLIHSREIDEPDEDLVEPVRVGRGHLANGELVLNHLCTPEIDCEHRQQESTWRGAESIRHFTDQLGEVPDPEECLVHDAVTELHVPVVSTEGLPATLTLHAQRVLSAGGVTVAVPLNDITPWLGAPDLEQSLRIWAPFEENQDLSPGEYETSDPHILEGLVDGESENRIPIRVDMVVHDLIEADLAADFWTDPVTCESSSVYFLVEDGTMGPTERVWWDGEADPIQLTPPVVDQETGELTTLVLDAYKVACDDWWDFNSGQSSHYNCENQAALYVSESDNDHLEPGHTYVSPGSSPLVIEARRWHDPDAEALLESFALQVQYTAP